ncbi:MAG: cbb3-type cytochrome oxidase assembly protein CcoS [Gammaproteobacteria bacterium]|nr:cbb3-type cytochrome oxidase assembly protein CcoS [Gammaproteobacteria bacterium]
MEIVYLLIPLVLILAGVVIAALFWAVKADQFDDLEGPAHRILQDDDDRNPKTTEPRSTKNKH